MDSRLSEILLYNISENIGAFSIIYWYKQKNHYCSIVKTYNNTITVLGVKLP